MALARADAGSRYWRPGLSLRPGGEGGRQEGQPPPPDPVRPLGPRPHPETPITITNLAVLKAKIKIKNLQIRAGISPKPMISLGTWQSGPSPGTPGAKNKIKNHFKHSQEETRYVKYGKWGGGKDRQLTASDEV